MALEQFGQSHYTATITPLRSGGRRDVEVAPNDPELPVAFGESDIITRLRQFFDRLEAEAQTHEGDPVALSQALARIETLLADVRSVRDTMKSLAAQALQDQKVRRLTISGVCTVEGTTEVKRTGWRHAELMIDMMRAAKLTVMDRESGEVLTEEDSAAAILTWLNPTWKTTTVKALGLDVDDYCDVSLDDDGVAVRTPTVRMHDNLVRRLDNITGGRK